MAENDTPTSSNGATPPEPRQTLREVAEAAWDEVVEDAPEGDEPPPVDDGGQQRDAYGRFVAKDRSEPGEAEPPPDGSQPRDEKQAPDGAKPEPPAPDGSSREPPQHWPENRREMFRRIDPEAQDFVLERVRETERFVQERVQAAATAVQFTNALAPVFQDPVIAGSLQRDGVSPYDAIQQWAQFHRRAVDPNPQVRAALLQELGERMGLHSAANGQMSPLGLSEQDLKDPVIRTFADYFGKTQSEMQALRGTLNQIIQSGVDQQNAQALAQSRWTIEQFAEAKDQQGHLLHPFIDHPQVMDELIEKFTVNPNRDLQQTYDKAVWGVPELRKLMQDAERQSAQQKQSNERARLAVRGNVRGITSPVSKPPPDQGSQGLRGTIEAAADEVGF